MRSAQKLTFCGVSCALSTVLLIATVFPYATYALAAIAGMVFLPVALELRYRYALMCYTVTGLLSLLLTPDIEAKVLFIAFFGFYPLIHLRVSVWYNRAFAWAVKLFVFNAAVICVFVLLIRFIGMPLENVYIADINVTWMLLPLGNVVFILYDTALTRVATLYRVQWHSVVKRLFFNR